MNIDTNAPLIGKKDIIINAPVDHVWSIQSDVNSWPKWQKDVSFAKLQGKLVKGTMFKWKAMGISITSVLQEVAPNKTIGWTGKSFGMSAVHFWHFEKQGNKTKITTEESLSGWLPKFIKVFKPDFLEQSLSKSLLTLKNHAENTK
ncbi:MAG: SRPBCC family protein [Candidatus Levybacteria bacterium]|nr:SRPBCC family protein [Candidatus Levybacteria bacterium]